MRIRVKIIKEHPGFKLGAEKSLSLDVANHLVKKGIGEIIGKVPTSVEIIKKAESTATDIEEIKKSITSEDKLVEKIKAVFEESTKDIRKSVEDLQKSSITEKDVSDIRKSVEDLANKIADAIKRLVKVEKTIPKK